MAIRNVGLGGATDWSNGEILEAPDLNDTFDAGTSKIQTLTAFWLNPDLYDVYDDFESYSIGAFTTNAKWLVEDIIGGSGGSSSAIEITNSTNAGGSGKELYIRAQANLSGTSRTRDVRLTTQDLPKNHHFFGRVMTQVIQSRFASNAVVQFAGQTMDFGFGQDVQHTGLGPRYHNFNVIAKGNDLYDVYLGGRRVLNNHSNPSGQWTFRVYAVGNSSNGHEWVTYLDDIRVSKSAVE